MRDKLRMGIVVSVVCLVVAACTGNDSGSGSGSNAGQAQPAGGAPAAGPASYPRNETLYTSGNQWGPPNNWNPITDWQYATGTEGLVYENLFLYDPLKGAYKPWLASKGDWTAKNVYQLTLRDGLTWSDGKPLTAEDVVFTFELGKFASVPYHNLWNWLKSAEAVDARTVRFTFSQPLYQEWGNHLYNRAIVPKHLWQGRSEKEVATGANEKPVGSGPYLYQTHSQDRMVWVKNDKWWGRTVLGLDVKPKYIVDIVNSNNNAALGLVLQGGIDLSNNFLPGIATLVKGGYQVQTYFPDPPYMLSANTAWLVMNTKKKPMSDPAFRQALANAVDVNKIVNGVYGQIVQAANPTGLLPAWDRFIDRSAVSQLGFGYDPAKARRLLADAGYKDTNGDKFVEGPGGAKIDLNLIVPNGWTDWMESIRVVAESARAVGIKVNTSFPEFQALVDARNKGNFDLLINNEKQLSNSPWEYYDYMFRMPVTDTQSTANFGRYENKKAWGLVQQLDKTPTDDIAGMRKITSQLQRIQLTELPVIPLWYNGAWAQANNTVWTGWPSARDGDSHIMPVTWRNYWEMGSILMLTELKPAATK
jgi:peptide/nickel transport system substrate-binding protein